MFGMPRLYVYAAAVIAVSTLSAYSYLSGRSAGTAHERANWLPQLIAAQQAKTAADARADSLTAASSAMSAQYEARHAETVQALNARAVAADSRVRSLVRDLAKHPGSCPLPEASGPAAVSDEPTAGDEFAGGIGGDLVALAQRCEFDSRTLADLQRWIVDQHAILR